MQITIRIADKYVMEIDTIAEKMGLKRSDITRMAIKKYIESINSYDIMDLFKRAKDLIGVVESGIPDLGQNHRKHIIAKMKTGADGLC